jgi:cytochrome c-type biogenesis protein CcmH/NrfG
MRANSLAFSLIGFGLGFAAMFYFIKPRAAELAKPTPVFAQSGGGGSSSASKPPLDTAKLKELEDSVKSNPADFDSLVELGNLQFDQQNYDAAAGYYRKALGVRPSEVSVRTDLGTALFYSNHIDDSLAELRKSLAMNPTHPQTLFNLGVVLLDGKKDTKGALEAWDKLVATNPDFPQLAIVKQQIAAIREQQK